MKKIIQLSITLGIAILVSTIAFGDSDKIYNPVNGHWYQRFDDTMTWHDAKQYCESLDGYLVTITSQEEDDFVYNNLGFVSPHDCWLGGTDESQEGDWRWITGENWGYTNWESTKPEPNNCDNVEHYLMYWTPNSWRGEPAQHKASFWNDTATGHDGTLCCSKFCGETWPMSTICKWDILWFFDNGVEAGTIVGRGNWPGNANFRLWLMKSMLQAAVEFIEQDRIGLVCFMLNGAHRRCDGEPRPMDFIEGEAVPALMVMIEDLRAQFGCE